MAASIQVLNWLLNTIQFNSDSKALDIGESCVVNCTPEQLSYFAERFGSKSKFEEKLDTIRDLSYRSTQIGNPQIPTTFLSEVFEYCGISYHAADVVIARRGLRIDLNNCSKEDFPVKDFDLIMNFGTTEHIINQFNAFKIFHDLTRVGGHMFHVVPMVGYVDHGYFCYKPLFFQDIAKANDYTIVEMWAFGPQGNQSMRDLLIANNMRNRLVPFNDVNSWDQTSVPAGCIAVLIKKNNDAEFRVGLELKTAAVSE